MDWVAGEDVSDLILSVPHAGAFWLAVWLEDAAGNSNPSARSSQVLLQFDDAVPPEALLQADDAWLGANTPASPSYAVEISASVDWPISGIRGYSLTVDGSVPDDDVEIFADQDYERFNATYLVQDLAEGITTVRLRSVSNSGVASDVIGLNHIKLDRTRPVLDDQMMPSPGRWYREALSIQLLAHDQADLSGMVPSAPDEPVGAGAYVAYELDGAATVMSRGAVDHVAVTADGHHTLSYRAYDAAGNASLEKEASFKIDGTAPTGAFRGLDPADPRALRVDVADATSGIADGRIEYRREGEGGFTRLTTTRSGGVLTARLDDLSLPPGRYRLRAVVSDVAGNEAVIGTWADGSSATLGMPLRLGAEVTVSREIEKAKRCTKATRKPRRGKSPKRKRARCVRKPARPSLELAHGKRAASAGRVTTTQGVPIAHAPVVVAGQPRAGGAFAKLGTATTDAQGRFRFTIPAGPSRTVRYRYDGTNTVKPAEADLATKVRAAARLEVDRRRLRNGQAVRFTGRLLGKPIPTAGKLVALQARVGRGWRTFATPRANAKGVFRHRYRFTETTGLRRYAFRAVVTREAAYSYEAGRSKTVKVTVRGR